MKNRTFLNWIFLVPITLSFLLGCGFTGPEVKKISGDPEKLYKEGLSLFNERDYFGARKKFDELKSAYPDSPPYTIWAELKVGDCHFLQNKYVEALAAYEEFRKVHPSHEETPYVQYQIGMCYFNQMLTLDRDQTLTNKALSSFEYLIANTPSSLFTEKAKEKVGLCKKRLADHEFYVGDFYYKERKFKAAALRFQGLLEKYPKIPGEDKTLYFLGKSYLELNQHELAESAFLKIIEEYPKSLYTKEAKTVLEKGSKEEKISLRKAETKDSKEEKKTALKTPVQSSRNVKADSIAETKKPPPPEIIAKAEPTVEENRSSISTDPLEPSIEKEKIQRRVSPENKEINLVDKSQPIDIISDQVEAYGKENLVIFRGNVTARQKDIVIYADSIEALLNERGKGINRVTAGGNVKIQQGVRVANCQKAIFYNLEQRMVLTGEPKVSEGDNVVSGEEILIDIEKNRVEVKGGPGMRGRAKVQPGSEIEKLK